MRWLPAADVVLVVPENAQITRARLQAMVSARKLRRLGSRPRERFHGVVGADRFRIQCTSCSYSRHQWLPVLEGPIVQEGPHTVLRVHLRLPRVMLVCNIALQVAFSLVCVVLLWVYMQGHLRYTWLVLACCVVPFIAYSGGLASFNASCKSSLEELKSLLHVTEVT